VARSFVPLTTLGASVTDVMTASMTEFAAARFCSMMSGVCAWIFSAVACVKFSRSNGIPLRDSSLKIGIEIVLTCGGKAFPEKE
jgi:peroxiredoxin